MKQLKLQIDNVVGLKARDCALPECLEPGGAPPPLHDSVDPKSHEMLGQQIITKHVQIYANNIDEILNSFIGTFGTWKYGLKFHVFT